jgi:SH3 domain-containing YSC84-like protein 1
VDFQSAAKEKFLLWRIDSDSGPLEQIQQRRYPMKKLSLIVLLLVFSAPGFGRESQLQKATNVFNEIMGTPDKSIPQELMEKAVCVGIVPSELKGAFILGGSYGRGVLVCRQHGSGPWGAPSMFTLGSGSIGFQVGGKATDVVFIVMNPEGARKLVQDSVKLGAQLSVAAGPVGRSLEGATDAQLHAEILSYSRTRGLFAGASLDGAVIKQDRDDNRQLYGRDVTAKQILIDNEVVVPPSAHQLRAALEKYSPRGGQSFNRV